MLRIASRQSSSSTYHIRTFSTSFRREKGIGFWPRSLSARSSTSQPKQDASVRMLMLAKPGSGKGTLSTRLLEKYGMMFLSAGDILRQHIKDKTPLGRKAEAIVAQGGLLPDDVMLELISTKLPLLKGKSWILDGFPRTLTQGKLLDRMLETSSSPLNLVIHLDVADEIIMSRITDRWIHPASGRVYNYSYNRPKVEGVDDVTGEPLTRRPDDNPEVFGRRLKTYYDMTAPLIDYYQKRPSSNLVTLSGSTSDEIWPQLDAVVQARFRARPKTTTPLVHEAIIRQTEKEVRKEEREPLAMPSVAVA